MIDLVPACRAFAAALACTLLAACDRGVDLGDRPDARAEPVVDDIPVVSPTTPCDTLSRQQCLGSTHCTLHWIKNTVYECRPDEGPCETSLSQNDKKGCIATPGCLYKEPACYCPFPGHGATKVADTGTPGGACACGGGAPAMCFQAGGPPSGPDAGAHDAGGHDVGAHDAGGHDVGAHDAGAHDAGGRDAGGRDAAR
ncbi:MAG: hypothetical protein WKG00_25410 [Polyangiaceae bacterium]